MKVTLTKNFTWCHDGIEHTVIPAGTEVESPIAENAVDAGAAEAPVEEKAEAPVLNKAETPPSKKRAVK